MSRPHTGHAPSFARGMRTSLSLASSSVTVSSANFSMSPMNRSRESSPSSIAARRCSQSPVSVLAALVLVALAPGTFVALGRLAVYRTPPGHEQDPPVRAKHALRHGGLHARVLELGVGMEDGQEAAYHEVVDLLVVGVELRHVVLGARGDDRVVVGDLLVVDHASQR